MPRSGSLQVGIDHRAVTLHGEDQRDIDRNAFCQGGSDGGQPVLGSRDLDEKVRPVHDLPQLDGLFGGLVGVVRQSRVDLDRDSTVDPVGGLPLRRQDIAGVTDVVGGHGADGRVHVGATFREFGHLTVVGVALRESLLEDRRVGRHADDAFRVDQLLQVAGLQTLPRQVIQPDGYAFGG